MVLGVLAPVLALSALSVALSIAFCVYARALAGITHLVDRPDGVRKIHEADTPLIGGFAILLPSFAVSLCYEVVFGYQPFVVTAIVSAAGMLLVGAIDDRTSISPVWRFAALIFIVFAVFSITPLFVLHTLALGGFGEHVSIALGSAAAPVTALMIIGFVNAANMTDGMNGQLLGSVVIWSGFIAWYLGIETALPFIALACSSLVALGFNLRGRLFSGNSGAYAASLFVGLGAIAAYRFGKDGMSADLPLVWFWLPVIDCVRLMGRRVLQGRSPLAGDRNHIHHILMEYMSPNRSLVVYLVMLSAPGVGMAINQTLGATILLMDISAYVMLVFLHESALTHARARQRIIVSPYAGE
jgi:UDP-GlcNAc:undecaprenyl-phosphate/decaprenyl-phosphate GlcNAc-1-phosphate transferase